MIGFRIQGRAERVEFIKDQHVVNQNEFGILNTFIWTYETADQGTWVRMDVEYTIPGAAVSKMAETVIHNMYEKEVETILANLKFRMENEHE